MANAIFEDCENYKKLMQIKYSQDGFCETRLCGSCTKCNRVCGCGGNKLSCEFYPEVRKEGIASVYSSPIDQEFLYWIRCHMTSINRYINNTNPDRDLEYKELARKASQAILRMVNGESKRDEET